ncbi:hypothetical protein HDV06_000485 [Boothiomyces sp. JEL0866]|nr:hypothetical protein HDV06_000485 [Boothiomyces sp. JEL0866]
MQLSKKVKRSIYIGLFVLIILVLVPMFSILNIITAEEKQGRIATADSNSSNGILSLEVLSFDFHQGFAKAKLTAVVQSTGGIIVDTGVQTTTFTNDSLLPTMFVTFPLDDAGFPFLYPFDNYTCTVSLQVRDTVTKVPIPLTISAKGHLDSWSVHIDTFADSSVTMGVFSITFIRNRIAKMFAFFIFTIMWLLSIAALTVAFYVLMGTKKVEPPIIAVTASLLFALPAIRNIQPGAPVIGCTLDVAGFFFNMVFVSISFLLLVYNYIMKTREERLAAKKKGPAYQ